GNGGEAGRSSKRADGVAEVFRETVKPTERHSPILKVLRVLGVLRVLRVLRVLEVLRVREVLGARTPQTLRTPRTPRTLISDWPGGPAPAKSPRRRRQQSC